jgi:serine protease AprX
MRNVRSVVVAMLMLAAAGAASAQTSTKKLGPLARAAADRAIGHVQVIVRTADPASLSTLLPSIALAGGTLGRTLPIINGIVATLPSAALDGLSQNPLVEQISMDRDLGDLTERTGATVGATTVREQYGYDGAGIGIAVIDSGITNWHDDLYGPGAQRVDRFVDFVNGRTTAYDDYGHGTHVAGIIAGNGFDSDGRRSGIAPASRLVVLKTLDANGRGRISNVIAALDYVRVNRVALNIRVVNLSVGAGVFESYNTDPLTVAAKRLVDLGVVVVTAAGNAGKDPLGHTRYGGVNAPGNAPWVITVGASSHMGTSDRIDDTMAPFSSRGPVAFDQIAKPDLVAPGVGIESLSDPLSAFYSTRSAYLLPGTVATSYLPYLSLNGTSMSAPVVTGTVALMMQANPALTPNAVKAILQYTAQTYQGYDALTQGAGFLNAAGAVALARNFADPLAVPPADATWSRHIIWANHRYAGGVLERSANAWATGLAWGAQTTATGAAVSWGSNWRTNGTLNVVWGMRCGGNDCAETWTITAAGWSLLGTNDVETIVWGNSDADTIVWGNYEADTIVWGNYDDTIVWGNNYDDTIVWGNGCVDASCTPKLWPVDAR